VKIIQDIHAGRYRGLMSKSWKGGQQRRKSRVDDGVIIERRVMHRIGDHILGQFKDAHK
jgi:hypothetical protein